MTCDRDEFSAITMLKHVVEKLEEPFEITRDWDELNENLAGRLFAISGAARYSNALTSRERFFYETGVTLEEAQSFLSESKAKETPEERQDWEEYFQQIRHNERKKRVSADGNVVMLGAVEAPTEPLPDSECSPEEVRARQVLRRLLELNERAWERQPEDWDIYWLPEHPIKAVHRKMGVLALMLDAIGEEG